MAISRVLDRPSVAQRSMSGAVTTVRWAVRATRTLALKSLEQEETRAVELLGPAHRKFLGPVDPLRQ